MAIHCRAAKNSLRGTGTVLFLMDMAMRRIFWGFCRNWFLIDPLHYLSSRSAFGFEFAEIFVIEKRLPNSANTDPDPEVYDQKLKKKIQQKIFFCLFLISKLQEKPSVLKENIQHFNK
jgi:hypothetical protein